MAPARCHNAAVTRPPTMIAFSINGQPHHAPVGHALEALLRDLALEGKRIAVELNGEIVPRSRYAATALGDGDRLEIVVAVGGG